MADNRFFDETREQSAVKSAIVAKYFWAWAKIIAQKAKRIAYLDLFAGPGRYRDGTDSTQLLVLQKAIEDPNLSQILVTVFNDKDEANVRSLEAAIASIPGIEKMKHKPVVRHEEVGSEMVRQFAEVGLVPSLSFIDPWGYRGLSLGLVNAVVKDWACECIFFFNYNRVNMGLSNPCVEDHMNALFGKERADALRAELQPLDPDDRELRVVERLCEALNPDGSRFTLPFRFRNVQGSRTSHHLIFVTKHFLGYNIMKGIMAKESSLVEQGVASLEYSPADKRCPLLFELARPLDDLEGMLRTDYAGENVTFGDLYRTHSVGKPYVEKNYRQVLKVMEDKGLIVAVKPGKTRRKGTFAEDVVITFLPKGR